MFNFIRISTEVDEAKELCFAFELVAIVMARTLSVIDIVIMAKHFVRVAIVNAMAIVKLMLLWLEHPVLLA